jgi:succinyl-diaminopimelate desuccinylase
MEIEVNKYIFDYIYQKYWDTLNYITQDIGNCWRYNLIVTNCDIPDVILAWHVDTVPESDKKQFTPEIIGDRLYWRWAVDMKSGVAINIMMIDELLNQNIKFWNLFYCDEEYNFLWMKKFIKEYTWRINPKITIITEPTDEKLIVGFRGVAEFLLSLEWRTSHSAKKYLWINAINEFYEFEENFENFLRERDLFWFTSSVNIWWIHWWFNKGGEIIWKWNSVADTVNWMLEIRLWNDLSKQEFEKFLFSYFEKREVKILEYTMNFWLSPLLQRDIIGKYPWSEICNNFWYSDIQMIKENLWGDCILFWPGPNNKSHQSDEYVEIDSIYRVKDRILDIIKNIF